MARTHFAWLLPLLAGLASLTAHAQDEGSAQPASSGAQQEPQADTIAVEPLRPEPSAAAAPEDDSTRLDTIEVTASKRVKTQREIPGSVGAIRGEALEKMSAQGLKDYIKLVPGVVYLDRGNEQGLPIIRGIATDISLLATPAPTGIYMEDMPFADLFRPLSIPDLNPFDLDRVEILKGPQGTLFGSGALAGAVRYLVQKPKPGIWEVKGSGTYSTTGQGSPSKVVAAALNAPFGDQFAMRGVGVFREDGGLYDERATDASGSEIRNVPDADKIDQASWRLLGSWDGGEGLTVSGFYFSQQTDSNGPALADNPDAPTLEGVPFESPSRHQFGGGNLLVSYDLGWGRLLSSTNHMVKDNYSSAHQEFALDIGNQDQAEYVSVAGQDVRGYTQELRLSSPEGSDGNWEWLVGVSYLHFGQDRWEYTQIGRNLPDPRRREDVSDLQKAEAQVYGESDQVGKELAFFGEATRRFGEHFEATFGGRAYQTTLDVTGSICGAQILVLFQTLCRPDQFDDEVRDFNPKLSLRYLHDRNIQLYALAAKGFQFGGVQLNPPAPGFPQSAEDAGFSFGPYKSSSLWNYELGLRTEWLDRRLRFDLTGFYLDWKDLQLTVQVPFAMTQVKFAVIGNASAAHSEGVEAALEMVLASGLTYTSSAAWIRAVTDEPFPQPDGSVVPPGARLPGTPNFQMANVLSYSRALPFFSSWSGGLALTHVHLGEAPNNVVNTGSIGGYDTFDARLSLVRGGAEFAPELSLGINNLTDVRAGSYRLNQADPTDASGTERIDVRHFIPPRTVVFSLGFKY